jgi:hypothetical protein
MDKEKTRKIEKIYTNAQNPGGYSGLENLYNAVKEKHPSISKQDVRHFLEGNRTYTLFRGIRKKHFPRSKTIPLGFMTNMQVCKIIKVYVLYKSLGRFG